MKAKIIALIFLLPVISCSTQETHTADEDFENLQAKAGTDIQQKLNNYVSVRLTADLSGLSEKQKQIIPLLIEASKIMDDIFWHQAYGDRDSLLSAITDADLKRYVQINYGPWDRLANNESFVEGFGDKPAGANFYPRDMTKEEFEQAELPNKESQYTLIRRDAAGQLKAIWYHNAFPKRTERAARLLREAAILAEDVQLEQYLMARAEALLNDTYHYSDSAWLDMKTNTIDIVIGPIETYEDKLFGYKAAHEAYVLVKDIEWSKRLEKYVAFLPELQKNLPVPKEYKKESPGLESQLNAYDVVYYAGDCNAGSKTIAINLPNDEGIQVAKGTRRLQLKNAMRAKYDKILLPIADELIADEQRSHITFDAFFANTMFHEVAHGLGIKYTIKDGQKVKDALKEEASALEEGKADVLGLYMVTQLFDKGELEDGELMDYYVTFLAGIFRSVRFGAASAHGRANMLRFNYFNEKGAFVRDAETGKYSVNPEKMRQAIKDLSRDILVLQGNGDYKGVKKLMQEKGSIGAQLQEDLNRLQQKGIPVDIVFEQGIEVLGLVKQ